MANVLDAIGRSPYPFAVVIADDGTLVGRLRADIPGGDSAGHVAEVMELGPSTVRPHRSAARLAERLAERDQRWAIVTTPEGRVLGIAWREDLERAS